MAFAAEAPPEAAVWYGMVWYVWEAVRTRRGRRLPFTSAWTTRTCDLFRQHVKVPPVWRYQRASRLKHPVTCRAERKTITGHARTAGRRIQIACDAGDRPVTSIRNMYTVHTL